MADNMYPTAKSADVTVSRAQGRLMPGRVVQAAAAVTMAAVCGTVQPATAQTPPQAAAPAIHFIWMGSHDCPPCIVWQRNELPKLQASPDFKAIRFSYVEKAIRSPVPPKALLPAEVQPFKALQARTNWNLLVWAYVGMPEHTHVLVRPLDDEYDIADFLKAMKQPVSQRMAAHYRTIGTDVPEQFAMRRKGGEPKFTFWQPGGGYDRNIFTARAIWDCIHYIHQNPVKRELVEEPGQYEWSSFRFYEGVEDVPFRVDRCEVWLS